MFENISFIWTIWSFLQSPEAGGIFLALFTLSEALGAIPQIRANGVFQLVYNMLAKLAKKQPLPPNAA